MPYGFEQDKIKKKVNDYGKIGDGSVGSSNQPVYIKDGVPIPTNKIPSTDGSLSSTSTNPVQNKVVTNALSGKANASQLNSVNSSLQGQINNLSNQVGSEGSSWAGGVKGGCIRRNWLPNERWNIESMWVENNYSYLAATLGGLEGYFWRIQGGGVVSDKRIKKNVKNNNHKYLESFKNIRPISFDYSKDFKPQAGQHVNLGYIAQDLKELFPDAVMVSENAGYKDFHEINYVNMIPYMMIALKEQVKINEKLQKEINELKSKLEGEK